MGCIVGRYTHLNTVPDHHLDSVLFHPSRKHPPDCDVVIAMDFHGTTTEDLCDYALQLDQIVSAQNAPFKTQNSKK